MRKFFKYASMMAVAVIAAASFASCSDDDTEGYIPQPTLGTVQVTDHTAALTITPPAGATSIFWACADSKTTPKEFTQVEVTSAAPIEITTPELNYGKYKIYAFAQSAGGNSKVLSSPEFEIALNDLVGYRIINKTAYSLDVQVTMGANCEKYVIGAFSNGSYKEEYFIESAELSITPGTESYSKQPYNVFYTDAIIPESILTKDTHPTSNENKGIIINYASQDDDAAELAPINYQIAIYAVDKQGEGHVIASEEFQVVQPEYGQGMPVKIEASSTLTEVTATYITPLGAKKLVRGFVLPIEHADVDFNDDAAVRKLISGLAVSAPPYLCLYDNQRFVEKIPKKMEPTWPIYIYAVAIDENGQMGELCYEKFSTQTPVLDGTATVDLEFVKAEENSLEFKVTLSEDASAIRLMATTKSLKEADVQWTFVDPELSYEYIQKAAYEVKYSNLVVENLNPGTTYSIYAVAVGRDGKISPVKEFTKQKTKEEVIPEPIDFSLGTGEAKLVKVSAITYYSPADIYSPEAWSVDYTYKVETGANTVNVYLIKMQDALSTVSEKGEDGKWHDRKETIEDSVLRMCETDVEMRERTKFTEFGVEKTEQYMQDHDETWGGSAIILVTEDADGHFKIADYYVAVADHNVKTERE